MSVQTKTAARRVARINAETLELTGDTWAIRHAIRAEGGRWSPSSKGWRFTDTPANRAYLEVLAGPLDLDGRAPVVIEKEVIREVPREGAEGLTRGDVGEIVDAALKPLHRQATGHAAEMTELQRTVASLAAALQARRIEAIELRRGDEAPRVIEGLAHTMLPTLIKALDARLHVWLAGPSGSGKTHGAEQAAKALGLSFELQGAMTMPHELTGFVDAGGRYHETPFVRAFRNGGLILLDELDAGSNEALLTLNAALANGLMSLPSGDVVRAHNDFRCIGAANTFGGGATADYVGRTRIDAAFLQRFGARLVWGYDEALELAMAGNVEWTRRVQRARKAAAGAGLKVLITPRASQAGARLIAGGMSQDEAARLTYLADLTPEQCRMIGEAN